MSCALLPGCVPGLAAAFAVEPPQAAGQTKAILAARQTAGFERIGEPQQATVAARCDRRELQFTALIKIAEIAEQQHHAAGPDQRLQGLQCGIHAIDRSGARCAWLRSEEHTSELQSLMRISYAGFCLKKK